MRIFVLMLALLCCLAIPVLAAETSEATTKRVTNLENTSKVLQEGMGNLALEVDTNKEATEKSLDTLTNTQKAMQAQLDQLKAAMAAEIAARDKMIAELRTEILNDRTKIGLLQADLDKTKAEQAATNTQLANAVAKNTKQDKKDRTITYVMGILLGGLALTQ